MDFHHVSWHTLWDVLSRPSSYQIWLGSRSDLAANILLYVPASFLWLGVNEYFTGGRRRLWVRLMVFICLVLLSFLIETCQIFLPYRSFDIRDVLCNAGGAVVGIVAWELRGVRIMHRVFSLQNQFGYNSVARDVLLFYLGVLAFYQLMPLDLTLSPVEIYRDMRTGGLILIPFAAGHSSWLLGAHDFSVEFFIWMIVGMLWLFSSRRSALRLWFYAILFAFVLEGLQLFVHSRVSDITDVLSAMAGSGVGIRVGVSLIQRFPIIASREDRRYRRAWVLLGMAAFCLWFAIIIWYYWFPFNFNFSPEYLAQRTGDLPTLPFWSHFRSNEFNALADILRTVLFYAPLGSVLGFVAASFDKPRLRRYSVEAATVFLLICAFIVEMGQFFLPGRYPDLTDIVFSVGAGLTGYWIIFTIQSRYQQQMQSTHPVEAD